MSEPLDFSYFRWLCSKVIDVREHRPERTFETLLDVLFKTEYIWYVTGDDNRAEDGIDLRYEFLKFTRIDAPEEWMETGCSVLEMLIAFARKAAYETNESTSKWFWIMLYNLELSEMNDLSEPDVIHISEILDQMIERTYGFTGHGGLFPLRETEYDQRFIEVWYQFNEYLYQQNIA
jgi:hypothetical protein